jgi:hypothetical protein
MTTAKKTGPGMNSLTEILQLDLANCEVQICMAGVREGDDAPDFQRVTITEAVSGEFRKLSKEALARRRKDLESGDLVLHSYDPGAKPDSHEVELLDLSEHQSIRDQISGLSDLAGLETFLAEDDFLSSLRFYVIVFRPKIGAPVFCFRTYSQKRELKRSPLLAIVLRQGHYDKFTDPLFLFDRHIDCISRGNDLFIFKKDKFQKIFQFYELLLKTAKDTLKIIKARIPIDNFDDFEQACEGHLQKVAKLKNIASKPYLQKVTMKDIKKVIKKYDLNISTVGKGKSEKIHFDDSDRWAILRLLDDDYLESVLTGNSYETNSKRPI